MLWENTGLRREDVDVPQVYDGFSPFVYFWLEALGYCEPGEAHRFVRDGGIRTATGLPVLSGGGALGNGRMHGVPQMLECYLQLSGRAGDRQRSRADVGAGMPGGAEHGWGGGVHVRADGIGRPRPQRASRRKLPWTSNAGRRGVHDMGQSAFDLDWIVSVDDHVIEPPRVWLDRLPRKYHDVAPRIVTEPDGQEFWVYEDRRTITGGLGAIAGRRPEDITAEGFPYSEMRPGCYDPQARLADMDEAGILASLNFPSIPRFCGQLFWEAKDKDLALLCVRAYNDWMIDEWCATAPGRYIPLTIIPLWDPQLAVEEIERTAAKGSHSFCFSENFEPLGLPTIHDPSGYWDPVVAAAQDNEQVLSIHIGSSSTMYKIASDSPFMANMSLGAIRPAGCMMAWIFSGMFQQFPGIKIALSEGSIGWIPWFLERANQVLNTQTPLGGQGPAVSGLAPRARTPSTGASTSTPSTSTRTTASTSTGASSTTRPGCACSTSSARTT